VHLSERRRRIALGAALLAITIGSLYVFRPGASTAVMLRCLPPGVSPGDAPVLYVDLGRLRKTGLLDRIAGQPGVEEAEYKRFVEASGFDYRRDLDAALVELRPGTALMVLQGRFDQARLAGYARSNGGQCAGEFCSLPGSRPERRISFQPITGRLLALAAGNDPMGAASIRKNGSLPPFEPPSSPIWMYLPGSALHSQSELPMGLSAFLEALDGAQRAFLTVELSAGGFEIVLAAPCASADKASTIAERLSGATATLQDLIARSGKPPEPASPAAILAAGRFSADQTVVRGKWPVSAAFFEALAK
jgi:hypothetical protein